MKRSRSLRAKLYLDFFLFIVGGALGFLELLRHSPVTLKQSTTADKRTVLAISAQNFKSEPITAYTPRSAGRSCRALGSKLVARNRFDQCKVRQQTSTRL
jgi:hypothetical protein